MTFYARARTHSSFVAAARLFAVAIISGILSLAVAGTAAAQPPLQGTFSDPLTFTYDCGTITLHEDAVDNVHFILFFGANGVPGPLQIHHSFRGVISNP